MWIHPYTHTQFSTPTNPYTDGQTHFSECTQIIVHKLHSSLHQMNTDIMHNGPLFMSCPLVQYELNTIDPSTDTQLLNSPRFCHGRHFPFECLARDLLFSFLSPILTLTTYILFFKNCIGCIRYWIFNAQVSNTRGLAIPRSSTHV